MLNFDKIDKTIHEKARLSIMTLLATRDHWSFQDLKWELKLSDGNLITHLRILYEAGLIFKSKERGDRPQTNYALTEKGRGAYQTYLNLLEQIIKTAKK